jgi:hypothetical protein
MTCPKRRPPQRPEHPGAQKNVIDALTDLNELTFSSLGPTSQVNLLLDVEVICSSLSDCYDGL